MLTIVEYGVGNLASIKNILRAAHIEAESCTDKDHLMSATKLILPGVGAFDTCAGMLRESGWIDALNKKVLEERIPVLGVCVGMQLLMEKSEEGVLPGLGWVPGRVVKFNKEKLSNGYKIPHMGWGDVSVAKPSKLFTDMYEDPRFYFVHSYHADLSFPDDALVHATYGYPFVAGVERGNILGVQFHPEKSHKYGMKLLENFAKYY